MADSPAQRAAWRALGRQLASLRKAAGHTQASLAASTCYGRSTVANVETGHQQVRRDFWAHCDDLLDAGGLLLEGHDRIEQLRRDEHRLTAGRVVPVLAAPSTSDLIAASGDDGDELHEIERRRRQLATPNVDEAKLTYLEAAVGQAVEDSERRPPAVLAPAVRHLRRHVDDLLDGRQHPAQRQRLYAVAVRLSALLGVLALDLGRPAHARAYAGEAFEMAEPLHEPSLRAWVRGVQSLIAYYTGDHHDALAYALDGQRCDPDGPQSVRLVVNGEARALARLGDAYGVDRAVERALTLAGGSAPTGGVSPSLAFGPYCLPRAAANAATAYLVLGRRHEVETYADQALAAFDAAGLRGPQALTRLDLATAALIGPQADPERAGAFAAGAVEVAADHRFESVHQRAVEFLRAARPWAAQPAVAQVAALVADRWDRPGRALASQA